MNVIVIVSDSLRTDHVGAYGNDWIKTPNIDALADDAYVIDGAYADSLYTIPARTSMWTGRINFPFRPWQPFEVSDLTLAEHLWDSGYTSALVTDVYHMHKPGFNMGRGFDETHFIRGQEYDPWILEGDVEEAFEEHFKPSPVSDKTGRFSGLFRQYLRNISVRETEEDYFCARTCTRAAEWLESRQSDAPIFLWVDLFDPHEPWDPPLEYKEPYNPDYDGPEIIDPVPSRVEGYLDGDEMENVRALYAGEVTFVDRWVGKLLDEAQRLGYFDDSLIIFLSDHGEPLDDHNLVRKHLPWCFEELVSVPMIVRPPGGTGKQERIKALVQHCDIAPTVCDAAGVDIMPGTHGHSILPLLDGKIDALRHHALTGIHNQSGNIRDDRWSYLRARDRSPELYDRDNDPHEHNNVIDQFPEIADDLDGIMHGMIDELEWQ